VKHNIRKVSNSGVKSSGTKSNPVLNSISAFVYLERSLVRRPIVPGSFADDVDIDPELAGCSRFVESPLSVSVFTAMCDFSRSAVQGHGLQQPAHCRREHRI
jgi:hypothetical protein